MYQGNEVAADGTGQEGAPEYGRDEVLPNYLEADQLAAETSRPVPRAVLSRRVTFAPGAVARGAVARGAVARGDRGWLAHR